MRTWARWFTGAAAAASLAGAPAFAQGYDSYPGAPPPGQGMYAPQPQAYQDPYQDQYQYDGDRDDDGWDDQQDEMNFRGSLSPYGEWISVPGVGLVWRPFERMVGADFQPYATAGHWVYTDYGWSWQSDYPWGWAPFHYGRWVYRPRWGWMWRPGRTWGPAWVEWREGSGYLGWSPMSPVGVTVIEPVNRSSWCFVETSNFVSLRLPSVMLAPERARITFGTTSPIRGRRSYDRGTFWQGPSVAHVATAVGRHIRPVDQVFSPHDRFRGRYPDRGGAAPVPAPPPRAGGYAPPPGVGRGHSQPPPSPPPSHHFERAPEPRPVFVAPPSPPPSRGNEWRERQEERREERREQREERREDRREDRGNGNGNGNNNNGHHSGGDRRHER
ncbi:MAG TPA: DUF6600 domain-containing protein [Myxococcaceae bacterium]|jgi:hypothetical protein